MSIIAHLEELRKALVISILSFVPASIIGWFLKDYTLELLLAPLKAINPGFKLLVLGPADKLVVDLKVAMFVGITFAMPVIIWQLWSFISPALKPKERKALVFLVPASVILFVVGVLFSYFTAFSTGIRFFYGYLDPTAGYIQATYGLKEYIGFAVSFILPFGAMFELPILILVLAAMGIVTPGLLVAKRKYAVLIILIVAGIITPTPDVITQLFMALPMYLLFEVSILLAYLVSRKKNLQETLDLED